MPGLKYRYDWKQIAEKARSKHQLDYKIGSVEDAVRDMVAKRKMDDPYQTYQKLQGQAQETELHASRGKHLQQTEKRNVLEFDIGGSGYQTPRAAHAHLSGQQKVIDNDTKVSFDDIKEGKKWKVHFWNKIGFLQKLPGFLRPNTEEEIRKHNEIVEKYGKRSAGESGKGTQKTKLDNLLEKRYGTKSTLAALKDKKEIYVKENEAIPVGNGNHVRRTRYSMPGPQGLGGISNRGTYSIQNLSQYMLEAGQDYLTPLFEEWRKKESEANQAFSHAKNNEEREACMKQADEVRKSIQPVSILLRGHSRGGVAVSHGAMRIKDWIRREYPRYEKYVQFEVIQMDPVAGYGSDHGIKRNINLTDEKRPELKKEMENRGMQSLGKDAETTVVYSLHSDHRHWFSPQIVDGAKRVILTTGAHSVYMDQVDHSQETLPGGKAHRSGYMDAATGEMYRNSGLNELPEGIYIADEKNRLIRIPNAEVGKDLLKEVLKDTSGQKGRHERINEVIDNWFEAREAKKDKSHQMSRERIQIKDLQDADKKERNSVAPKQTHVEPEREREHAERVKSK